MTTTGRRGGVALTAGLALLLAAACGTAGGRTGASGAAPVDQPNPDGVYGGTVSGIRAVSGTRFELTLTPVNAEQDCSTDPTATVTDSEPQAVYVTTTYRVSSPACTSPTLTTTLDLTQGLGGRMLVVDQQAWVLEPAGATSGALRRCDDTLGCDPRPATCDDDSYRLALDAGDFPRNGRTWEAQACEVPWLVLDVDITASGCAATGDDPASNPCLRGPRRITRWVFTARGPLWDTVATLPLDGGCGQQPPPGLPRALCQTLPPAEPR